MLSPIFNGRGSVCADCVCSLAVDSYSCRAALCSTPKTCQLAFRIVVSERVTPELLPYVWRIRDNVRRLSMRWRGLEHQGLTQRVWAIQVSIEARKIRRSQELPLGDTSILSNNTDTETIGPAKVLTIRQFYYIYCFLSGERGRLSGVHWWECSQCLCL